jgi:hypothetical protein
MQYMHDNLNMHIVCNNKMKYSHYGPNSYYIWESKMKYMHDNLQMHIICGGKI